MAKIPIMLTYSKETIKEPLIYNAAKKFNVVTNIRRADVQEGIGWIILELDGEPEEIDKVTKWFEEQGVRVDPPEGQSSG
ncbi:MAG: NIL domain-containing protein [Armatimonadetes bacterium]|nr:NIL domain-containing protein [Armatimonadota bacterium]